MALEELAMAGGNRKKRSWPTLLAGDDKTQTIDLDSLFASDVTESGSFDLRQVKFASFGRLLESLSVPTLLIGPSLRIEFVNAAFSRITGREFQVVGRTFSELLSDPQEAESARLLVKRVFEQRSPEVREQTLQINRTRIWTRVHFRTIRLGRERLVLVQIENLTAQKQLLSIQKYRKLVHIFPIGIVELAVYEPLSLSMPVSTLLNAILEAKVLDGNNEFANMYNRQRIRNLRGVKLRQLFPIEARSRALLEDWIRSQLPIRSFETRERSGPGDVKYFENTLIGNVSDMRILGLWWLRRDVSEKKRNEEEVAKAQKLESLGILAGGIAHDFNNLLTGIMGNMSLLQRSPNLSETDTKRLDAAIKASSRAQELTMQLLTFSQGGSPIKKTGSIGDLLRDSVEFTLRGSSVRCECSIPDNLWPIDMDEGQIHQVINNLVINAVQAMPQGGVLKVGAMNLVVGDEPRLPLPHGNYVRIWVQDFGLGIQPEHVEKVFDPYFTTKEKGTGLGLATSYSVIRRHGGLMTVKSEIGVGSTFYFFLPASTDKPAPKVARSTEALAGSGRILVMDDDEMIRDMAGEMLTSLGYEATLARDGNEAVQVYAEALRAGKPFDVVIMDLTIPGGTGGQEAIQQLLRIDPKVRAVASSGYSNCSVMSEFKEYGFTDVLPKPYDVGDVSKVLKRLLERNANAASEK